MKTRAGDFARQFPRDYRLTLGQSIVGWVGQYGKTLLSNHVDVEPRYQNLYPGAIPTMSELSVPIGVGGEVIGVLDVQSPQLDAFDEDDVILLETLADQIATAIESARLYEETRDRAERLAIANRMAQAANKELESFSYSVSHDLRAPLRHIDGFVRLVLEREKERLDETSLRYLDNVIESSGRMSQLIDDLLKFSRTGRAELEARRVDLDQLVREAQQELVSQVEGRQIAWEIGPLPIVEGDPGLLRQVWVNLLSNAIKYTGPCPEARIEIGAIEGDAGNVGDGREVTLFVRDNGVGFDPQYTHKLFGVFQRLHSESQFEGTGIGLATAQRVVHRHGGRMWAEGEPGHGATFYFVLRTAKQPESD
jgi:light-regulated signal transduction histidine kinase (bacteriophytochrome)